MRLSVRAMGSGVALALVLGACGALSGDDDSAGGEQSGTVAIGGCEPSNPLVPAATDELCGRQPLDAIFSTLVRHDPESGEAVNEIAQSVSSDDHVVWRIELKPGWTFHDGTTITASSFVDAWNWGAHGSNAATAHNSSLYSIIEGFDDVRGEMDEDGNFVPGTAADTMSGLEVIDDTTLEVTLTRPEPGFSHRLSHVAFAPLPEAFFGTTPEEFGASPIGSGPFQFVEHEAGEQITLEPYDGYQGDVQPKVGGVSYRIFDSPEAQYANLLAGEIDVMPQLPAGVLAGDVYKSDLGGRYVEQETGVLHMLGFAPDADSGLADPQVRQAISMAIDRRLVVDNIFQGAREIATGWVSPIVEGHLEDQCGEFCTYDPDRARDMLADAGFDGELTINYSADDGSEAWVEATCNNIAVVLEVSCTTEAADSHADLVDAIRGGEASGMFWIVRQMEYPSIESFLVPLYSTDADANLFGYSNEQFDSLIAEAASLSGGEAQGQAVGLFQEAERLLVQQMPTIPMWFDLAVAGYSERAVNVAITPFGTVDLLTIAVS